MAQPNKNLGVFHDPLPRHNNNINHISSKAIQQVNHNYHARQNNEFMGFSNLDFSFIGGIDITLDYEYTDIMEVPLAYQIIEVYDNNMIKVTTRIGRGNDKVPLYPPKEAQIHQILSQDKVQIKTQAPRASINIHTQI